MFLRNSPPFPHSTQKGVGKLSHSPYNFATCLSEKKHPSSPLRAGPQSSLTCYPPPSSSSSVVETGIARALRGKWIRSRRGLMHKHALLLLRLLQLLLLLLLAVVVGVVVVPVEILPLPLPRGRWGVEQTAGLQIPRIHNYFFLYFLMSTNLLTQKKR